MHKRGRLYRRFLSAAVVMILFITAGCAASSGTAPATEGTEIKTSAEAELQETVESELQETAGTEDLAEQTKKQAFMEGKVFADDLPDEDLPKPSRRIASLEDYIYALDYMAFYRIDEKVFFEIDPAYAEEIYNPYTVHQKAYEMADLADVYACQMDDSYYSQYGVVGIRYSMSKDIASVPPSEVSETPVLPSFDYGTKADGAQSFTLPDMDAKTPVRCSNSEQLYYLVMNGYRPEPEAGSCAEKIYEESKTILQDILTEDMAEFDKIKAIYDWLTTEVRYDKATAYTSETYLVKEQAYYLEGVFFNRCAVCDGKAKACALLMNMAGIPCFRTTGWNEGGDHAWNMVQLEGTWYICCTTYGQSDMTDSLGRIVPDYSMLLAGKHTPYEWYPAQKHPDVEAQLSEEPYDCYGAMGKRDQLSLKIANVEELKELITKAEQCGKEEYKIGFQFTGEDAEQFEAEMTGLLEAYPGANAARIKSEGEPAYQIFRLAES